MYYKLGLVRPSSLRGPPAFTVFEKCFVILFVRNLANMGGGEENAERECHCPEVQETDGLPWI